VTAVFLVNQYKQLTQNKTNIYHTTVRPSSFCRA